MALTRKALSAMGIEDDKIEQIIEMHTETVNALKDERDKFKADASKLSEVEKELEEVKEFAKSGEKSPYKKKYEDAVAAKEALQKEFEDYKTAEQTKATKDKKAAAYKQLLKEAGISEKRIDSILRVSDIDSLELEEDGKLKDADKHSESAKKEWADFIETTGTKGADTATPPNNTGGETKTPSVAAQRAAAYHENLYGKTKEE